MTGHPESSLIGEYVLGTADPADRASVTEHLASCGSCRQEAVRYQRVNRALLAAVPLRHPPSSLRDRVMREISAPEPPRVGLTGRLGWLAMAALIVLTVAVSMYAVNLRERVADLEARLVLASRALQDAHTAADRAVTVARRSEEALRALGAPEVARIDLQGQAAAPGATGRAFWSPGRGLLFTATELPALPADRTYQVWYLTESLPVSAGVLEGSSAGTAGAWFDAPATARPVAIAVTSEPAGGVPQPTGAIYLVGQVPKL